jgi:hypothetical protein
VNRLARAWPLALLLLAGCGMYGDLYLDEESPRVPEITEAAPIAADEAATGDSPDAANGADGADDGTTSGDDERKDREPGDDGAAAS